MPLGEGVQRRAETAAAFAQQGLQVLGQLLQLAVGRLQLGQLARQPRVGLRLAEVLPPLRQFALGLGCGLQRLPGGGLQLQPAASRISTTTSSAPSSSRLAEGRPAPAAVSLW